MQAEKPIAQKVVVYVVQNEQLLVFRHVDFSYEEVGIQVPAGSIRAGESPREAALRELKEETGRDTYKIIASLGTCRYDMTPYRFQIQQRHFFLVHPTKPLPARWMSEERHDELESPTRFECFWIPLKQAHILQSGQGAMLYKIFDFDSAHSLVELEANEVTPEMKREAEEARKLKSDDLIDI